ncbi:MAG TPA: 30S ribosome-binding factor RbfA [Gammaproteobacteria bacterium]|nr:30S ribosome-binding factor RbfA [Gammaproteobacteria bacterium]
MPKDFRMQRIAGLMRTTLSELLLQEREKRFNEVVITRVIVSRDLASAKIYVSFITDVDPKEMVDALNHDAKTFRYHLANTIKLRVTPELRFYYDDSHVKGQRITDLLNEVLKGK